MMHLDGTPATMQQNAPYKDAVTEVKSALSAGAQQLAILGFDKIILDPGLGFGKSLQNNYQLLKGLPVLGELGYPLLAGVSRKSMIGRVTGGNPVTALNGTTVLNTIALLNGASILRVHDAEEARQAIELVEFYRNA
jgi:dihydropteroate synthase